MRSLIILVTLLVLPFSAWTQTSVDEDVPDGQEVFTIAQEMPAYPGGEGALLNFLSENIRYPDQAITAGIEGVVYVTFVVEKDGSISDTHVIRGIGGGCDEEAVKVVGLMPAWKPGKQGGKAVRTRFNIPIRFKLMDEQKEKKSRR